MRVQAAIVTRRQQAGCGHGGPPRGPPPPDKSASSWAFCASGHGGPPRGPPPRLGRLISAPSYTTCSPLGGVADSGRVALQKEIASITAGSSRLERRPAASGRERSLPPWTPRTAGCAPKTAGCAHGRSAAEGHRRRRDQDQDQGHGRRRRSRGRGAGGRRDSPAPRRSWTPAGWGGGQARPFLPHDGRCRQRAETIGPCKRLLAMLDKVQPAPG